MLSNAYFLAKFRFDTAENEPAKNLQNFAKFCKKNCKICKICQFWSQNKHRPPPRARRRRSAANLRMSVRSGRRRSRLRSRRRQRPCHLRSWRRWRSSCARRTRPPRKLSVVLTRCLQRQRQPQPLSHRLAHPVPST